MTNDTQFGSTGVRMGFSSGRVWLSIFVLLSLIVFVFTIRVITPKGNLVRGRSVRLVGSHLDRLAGVDIYGRQFVLDTVSARGKGTVVYLFSPTCHWCQFNESNFNRLVKAAGSEYSILAVSASGTDLLRFAKARGWDFPVLQTLDSKTSEVLGAQPTPTTIVIGPNGIVESIWEGAYTGSVGESVGKAFGISFHN